MLETREALAFDDVVLEPQFSDIRSRSEIDLTTRLGDLEFKLPIISSPMDTITTSTMAIKMAELGGLGIIHRYFTIEQQCEEFAHAFHFSDRIGCAVGVTGDWFERIKELFDEGCRIFCIDVAHGHHILVKEAIEKLYSEYENDIYIIAGNVATPEGFQELSNWGNITAIRLGVGSGSICKTRIETGSGFPLLQSIMDCYNVRKNYFAGINGAAIIADGGIRNAGDATKAFAAGADFIMLGSLLAGTDEAPGEIVSGQYGSGKYKKYRGMAAVDSQNEWRGTVASVEGVSTVVPYKGPVEKVIVELVRGIKSGLSYSGCRNITEFQKKAVFRRQTHAGYIEGTPHILE